MRETFKFTETEKNMISSRFRRITYVAKWVRIGTIGLERFWLKTINHDNWYAAMYLWV